jgi:catechol 2,3-dioxygenase-like lactoylglutathione lyase family enzyme
MLLDGVNHVAILTNDTDALHAFYREVFDAEIGDDISPEPGFRLSFVHIGPHSELNVFQVDGNDETAKTASMFGRGPIDHMGLQAASIEAFDTIRDRLIERGAADEGRGLRHRHEVAGRGARRGTHPLSCCGWTAVGSRPRSALSG